jgi:hypothetical protein
VPFKLHKQTKSSPVASTFQATQKKTKSSRFAVPFKPHTLTKSSPVAVPFKPHKLAAAHKHKRPHQCHQYLSSTVHVCDVITPTLRAHNNCMICLQFELSNSLPVLVRAMASSGWQADVFSTPFLIFSQS